MERIARKPFQGVTNIIRFNWHFYVVAVILVSCFFCFKQLLPQPLQTSLAALVALAALGTIISLVVSFYIYDCSDLYTLKWLDSLNIKATKQILNINAGFDETSILLQAKYPQAQLTVLDFYDPSKHTEISIERARKAYPAYPGTIKVATHNLPLEANTIQNVFLILAAHEIRDNEERTMFFKQLKNSLRPDGKIIVVEHLRDLNNFLAYNFGFFHFYSKHTWLTTFSKAGLYLESQTKLTPFISVFILSKNGATA